MSKTFSQSDVASHNTGDNLWIIVDEDVYDLTKFQDEHPGMWQISSIETRLTNLSVGGKKSKP
jgi:cytochrome b involved in lipid metabolism